MRRLLPHVLISLLVTSGCDSGGVDSDAPETPAMFLAAADSCSNPPSLLLTGGASIVTSSLAGVIDDGVAVACGTDAAADAFFLFGLEQASRVTVAVSGSPDVRVALLPGRCPMEAPITECATAPSAELFPGPYLVAVFGPTGAEFALSVTAEAVHETEPWPPVVQGEPSCSSPAALWLAGGPITLRGTVRGDNGELGVTCASAAASAGVFYSFTTSSRGRFSYTLTSPAPATAALFAGECSAGALAECSPTNSFELEPGNWVLGIGAAAGTEYELSLSFVADGDKPGTCVSPLPLSLGDTPVLLSGDFFEAADEQHSEQCLFYGSAERIYKFQLDSASDLEIEGGGLVYVRSGTCATGPEVACGQVGYQRTLHASNLPAGEYYLFVEPYGDAQHYDVSVSRRPPEAPPANQSCSGAIPLTFLGDTATVTPSFTGVQPGDPGFCGGALRQYYEVELPSPARLEVSTGSYYLAAAILSGTCTDLAEVSCVSLQECTDVLPAGTYYVRLALDSGHQYDSSTTVTVKRVASPEKPTNDTCSAAQSLEFDAGRASVTGTLAGADWSFSLPDQLGCSASAGGADVFYTTTLANTSDLTVSLTGSQSYQMQVGLVVGDDCGSLVVLGCASGAESKRFTKVPPGNVWAVVQYRYSQDDSNGPCPGPTSGAFALRIDAVDTPPSPENDTCATASSVALATRGALQTVSGTSVSANNDYGNVVCPGYSYAELMSGGDTAYAVSIGEEGVLSVLSTARSLGSMYLLRDCGDTHAWACGTNLLTTGFAVPPGLYYLIVDQKSADAIPGPFSLSLRLVAP